MTYCSCKRAIVYSSLTVQRRTCGKRGRSCRSCRADVLLLEVCPHPPRTLQDRLLLANDLRDVCPHCKTVLLVDEAEYPELATAVCLAKKDHIVDDFVYASVSPAYLSAMMDTL